MMDDEFEHMLDENAYSERRWVDLEAAELHAARARQEKLKRRSVSSSPPRERRRLGDPSDGDAPPGLGGEIWAVRDTTNASYNGDSSLTEKDLRRRVDVPGPQMVGKVTARAYEVDRRGETKEQLRRERESKLNQSQRLIQKERPRPPGEAHALRPTVTANTRVVNPEKKSKSEVVPEEVEPSRQGTTVKQTPSSPNKKGFRSEGVTFVWSGSGAEKSQTPPDAPAVSRNIQSALTGDATVIDTVMAPKVQVTTSEPKPVEDDVYKSQRETRIKEKRNSKRTKLRWGATAVYSFGSGAVKLRGGVGVGVMKVRNGVCDIAKSAKQFTKHVTICTKSSAVEAGSIVGRGVHSAYSGTVQSLKAGVRTVGSAAHVDGVVERVLNVCGGLKRFGSATSDFLVNNENVSWNVYVPPLAGLRVGNQRGLGWFKITEGDQPDDHRGPGDKPTVHRKATPRRLHLKGSNTECARFGDITLSAFGDVVYANDFPQKFLDKIYQRFFDKGEYDSEDEDDATRRALFENFEGYEALGRDFAATAAAAAAAVAQDAERLEKALREADWTAPLPTYGAGEKKQSQLPAATYHPALTPRRNAYAKKVNLHKIKLEDYEESLATRVRTLQRMFPEVSHEIGEAVYAFSVDEGGEGGSSKAVYAHNFKTPSRRSGKKTTLAVGGMTRAPVSVKAATRVVEELEAASVSVLMHGKVPNGETMRNWLVELAEGRGMGREAWRDEHGAFFGKEIDSPQTNGSYDDDPWRAVESAAGGKSSPKSEAAAGRLVNAFAGWSGRDADDTIAHDTQRDEDLLVMTHKKNRAFRAWRDIAATGPISKHTLATVHKMQDEEDEVVHSTPITTRERHQVKALADRTNLTVGQNTSEKKPSPPRRIFNLIATPFRKDKRSGGSPHGDWGTSESDADSYGVSGGVSGVSSGVSSYAQRRQRSVTPESPSSSSSDIWMSAGAGLSTPGSVTSRGVTSNAPGTKGFESAKSRMTGNTFGRASATPTVYFPHSPASEDSFSEVTPGVSGAARGASTDSTLSVESLSLGKSSASSTPTIERLNAMADEFVLEDTKSPGPMKALGLFRRHQPKSNSTNYELSPTSPLVGVRHAQVSRSPSSSEMSDDSELEHRKRSSSPGSRAHKNAAAASLGAPTGFVTAARAAFEREAQARSYDAPTPTRGSRVRR